MSSTEKFERSPLRRPDSPIVKDTVEPLDDHDDTAIASVVDDGRSTFCGSVRRGSSLLYYRR